MPTLSGISVSVRRATVKRTGAQEIELRATPRWLAMMLPSFISWIQSHASAIAGLCVASRRALPRLCTRFRSNSKARSEFAVSRLPVGSSARITFGSLASARAMATRCCSPPERWRLCLRNLSPKPYPIEKIGRALTHLPVGKLAELAHRNHHVFLRSKILH